MTAVDPTAPAPEPVASAEAPTPPDVIPAPLISDAELQADQDALATAQAAVEAAQAKLEADRTNATKEREGTLSLASLDARVSELERRLDGGAVS